MCYKLLRLYDGIYKLVYYAEDGSYSLTLKKLESADDAQEYNPFPHQVKLSIALLAENLCDVDLHRYKWTIRVWQCIKI